MPIQVTCPGCMARFTVSDKYSGKTGPCPKCKKEIIVPDKSQEVVIHAPETLGPKNSKGVPVLKPIRRREFHVGRLAWLGIAVGVVSVLAIAIAVRLGGAPPPVWLIVLGALGLAPPIVMLAYTFLRNDELEGYTGREYLARTAICSIVFAVTWFFYYAIGLYLDNKSLAEIPSIQMAILMVGMIAIGTCASLATLELEIGQSIAHYLTYFAATFFLCLIMGIELAEPLAVRKATPKPATLSPLPMPLHKAANTPSKASTKASTKASPKASPKPPATTPAKTPAK